METVGQGDGNSRVEAGAAGKVRHYRELIVWQRSMELATELYTITEQLPKHETYGLVSQMRRAAVSIASNIAEGHARESTAEFAHHLSFSQGSVAELETQLLLSCRLGYLDNANIERVFTLCSETGKMLRGLMRGLKRSA